MVKKPSHATVPLKGRELGIYTKRLTSDAFHSRRKMQWIGYLPLIWTLYITLNEFYHNIGGIIFLTQRVESKYSLRSTGIYVLAVVLENHTRL